MRSDRMYREMKKLMNAGITIYSTADQLKDARVV
jgi:hypothetical protein